MARTNRRVRVLEANKAVGEASEIQLRVDTLHRQLSKSQYRVVGSLLTAVSVVGLLTAVILNGDAILTRTPIWITYIAVPLIGTSFFAWRQRGRLSYGMAEVMAGAVAAIHAIIAKGYSYSLLESADMLQIVGGIYVIVRGLDNVGKAIEGSSYEKGWKRLFG